MNGFEFLQISNNRGVLIDSSDVKELIIHNYWSSNGVMFSEQKGVYLSDDRKVELCNAVTSEQLISYFKKYYVHLGLIIIFNISFNRRRRVYNKKPGVSEYALR